MKQLLIISILFISINSVAQRYWVGGGSTTDFNATGPTNWSASSGGSNNATVPNGTITDVYFNGVGANANGTCNVSATVTCRNMNMNGFTGTMTGTANINTYGNLIISSGCTFSMTATIFMTATSGTNTITTNTKSMYRLIITGAGGTFQLQDAIICTGYIRLTNGIFDLNGQNVSCSNIYLTAGTKTLTGGGSLTLTSQNGLDFATEGTGFTYTHSNSTIHLTANQATTVFAGNGNLFYNVYFDGTTGGAVISGSNSFNELKIAPASAKTYQFTDGTTQTVTTLTAVGSFGKHITLKGTSTGGWAIYKTSGTTNCDWLKLSYCTGSGGTWNAGINSCNVIGNSGWDFTKPAYIPNNAIFY